MLWCNAVCGQGLSRAQRCPVKLKNCRTPGRLGNLDVCAASRVAEEILEVSLHGHCACYASSSEGHLVESLVHEFVGTATMRRSLIAATIRQSKTCSTSASRRLR